MIVRVQHVRKKDLVQVMSGKDKGKTGKVLRVAQKHGKVVIEKLNIVKRHTKGSPKQPGGIIEREAPLSASVVLLYCEKCNRGVRVFYQRLESGRRVRSCKRCKAQLDK